MTHARLWLPHDTNYAPLEDRITAAVRSWAQSWFGDDGLNLQVDSTANAVSLPSSSVQLCASGAWLIASETMVEAMGRAALQLGREAIIHEADRPVIESVGSEALEGLRDHLVRELRLEKSGAVDGRSSGIPVGSRWTIEAVSVGLRVDFVLSEVERTNALLRLLPKAAPAQPLATAVDALAPLKIELSATLGRCAITVAELRTLAPGDVLLFDRPLDAHLPLMVNGTRATRGSCSVARESDGLRLQIIEPLTRTHA